MENIKVWDWPVRIGHWLLVGSFIVAWLSGESESFRLVHVLAGGCVVGVASFRLVWGVIGTRYARFGDFVHGPKAVLNYLYNLLRLRPQHHVGHNPAGGWAILLLLGLGITTGLVGWLIYNDIGSDWLDGLHEGLASLMLGVVLVHIAGVLSGSLLHGENLVRAMWTGNKQGEQAQAIPSTWPLAGAVLLIWVVGTAWWLAR